MPEKLIRRTAVPEYIREKHGVKVAYRTLNKYGCVGGGPEFVKFGNAAFYKPETVDRWVAERLRKGKAA